MHKQTAIILLTALIFAVIITGSEVSSVKNVASYDSKRTPQSVWHKFERIEPPYQKRKTEGIY